MPAANTGREYAIVDVHIEQLTIDSIRQAMNSSGSTQPVPSKPDLAENTYTRVSYRTNSTDMMEM